MEFITLLFLTLSLHDIYVSGTLSSYPDDLSQVEERDFPTDEELRSYKLKIHNGTSETEFRTKEDEDSSIWCITTDTDSDNATGRAGVTSQSRRWKTYKYFVSPAIYGTPRRSLNVAISLLQQALYPCLPFQELSTPSDPDGFVSIQLSSPYCQATIGYDGKKAHTLQYTWECLGKMRKILHELIHTLGVVHEQNRPDRDSYVTINYNNIKSNYQDQFTKYSTYDFSSFGVAYNQNSVMHYTLTEFSSNGQPTMTFKYPNNFAPYEPVSFGPFTYTGLQATDIVKLKKMYGCIF